MGWLIFTAALMVSVPALLTVVAAGKAANKRDESAVAVLLSLGLLLYVSTLVLMLVAGLLFGGAS